MPIDPFTAASTGIALFGAISGKGAQEDEFALRQEANAETRRSNRMREMLAQRLMDQQNEGVTTGTGSRSRYVPGKGFVTELSPMEQTITNANLARMMEEGPGSQSTRNFENREAAKRRIDAGADATSERRNRNAPATRTVDSILGDLLLQRNRATNDEFNDVSGALATQALRTGDTTNLGNLANQRAQATRANMPTRTQATSLLDQMMAQKSTNSINQQSSLESMARRGEAPAQQIANPVDNITASLRATNPQTAGVAGALATPRPMDTRGDFSTANLLNSSASALFGFGEKMQADDQRNQLMDLLANRQRGNSGYPAQGANNAF